MKTWQRAALARFCGNCHARIAQGAVYCLWKFHGITSEKVRCVDCAGEAAPTDFPARSSAPPPPPTACDAPVRDAAAR
jgi:hypothetical protein